MIINGYKIFDSDWTCRGKQYTCPGEFVEDVEPVVCECGMHFCPRIIDCLLYYPLERRLFDYDKFIKNKVAIVQADTDECDMSHNCNPLVCGTKYAASRLKIVKELSDEEIIDRLTIEFSTAFTLELGAIIDFLKYCPSSPTIPNSLTQNVLQIAKKIYAERVTIRLH